MQIAKRLRITRLLLTGVVLTALFPMANAQQMETPSQQAIVRRLIKFSGTLKDSQNKLLTGTTAVTFSIYASQEEGTPLWSGTQEVTPPTDGLCGFAGGSEPEWRSGRAVLERRSEMAIQGFYQVVQENDEQIRKLESQLQALEERMARFEAVTEARSSQRLPAQ